MARRRLWAPFSDGAEVSLLSFGGEFWLDILSVLASNWQEPESYTVVRVLYRLLAVAAAQFAVITCGIAVQTESLPLAGSNAEDVPTRNWLYHEEFCAGTEQATAGRIERDVRGMRKAIGADTTLWFYINNRSPDQDVTIHLSGRALILLH